MQQQRASLDLLRHQLVLDKLFNFAKHKEKKSVPANYVPSPNRPSYLEKNEATLKLRLLRRLPIRKSHKLVDVGEKNA